MKPEFDLQTTLTAVANIEHNRENHGSSVKYRGKTYSQYRNNKVWYEDENGNKSEVEVNPWSFASPFVYKFVLRLDEKPVFWDQVENLDPMLRVTKGLIMIKYTPKSSPDYKKGRPFKIGQDLLRWDIRVSGPREWKALSERVPEIGWLYRNTTLTPGMFDLAAQHPGMTFWCNVKWEEYAAKIRAQSEEHIKKPFVAHKVSVKEYVEIFKAQDKTLMLRCFNDIIKDINQVENSPAVQKEMLDSTGETFFRERPEQERDSLGRFGSKVQKEN